MNSKNPMGYEKINREQARQDALRVLDEYENVLVFGFKKNGESALVGVTDDEIYDKLGLAIAKMLENLGREVEAEAGFAEKIAQKYGKVK